MFPKLKHNRCELPQAAQATRLQNYTWILASSSWGAQPWIQDTLKPSHTKSTSLAEYQTQIKDTSRTTPVHSSMFFGAPLEASAIGSYSFTSTLLPVDYPAQRPSPVQAPQVSLASLRN